MAGHDLISDLEYINAGFEADMEEVNVSKVEQPVADEEELVVGSDVLCSLLLGFVGTFVLKTAVVLGLPDIIARAGPDETLVQATGDRQPS